jgi:hypothetical protein
MSTLDQQIRFAELIERVVAGRISVGSALQLTESTDWNDIPWKERTLDLAWHLLKHFQVDEDIRAKDPTYDTAMKSQLLEYAARLRSRELDERAGWWQRWFR